MSLRSPELVNLAGQETGREVLSHSSIGVQLSCAEKHHLHYGERLRPKVTATPLVLGGGFARALEEGDPQVAWDYVMGNWMDEVARVAGNPWVSVPSRDEAEVGAQISREAARAYLKAYGQHGQTREFDMRVRLRNPEGRVSLTHDLVCRADAVDLENALLIEDKLGSSKMRQNLERRVVLDRQVSIECYCIWRTTGVLIRRVDFRLTLKPGIKLRKGETHDGYLERIAEEYATRPDYYLVRAPATRTVDDFLRLEHELWAWAEDLRRDRRRGVWPRNTAACTEYSGCVYLPLCSSEPGAHHNYMVKPPHEVEAQHTERQEAESE